MKVKTGVKSGLCDDPQGKTLGYDGEGNPDCPCQ